MKWLFKRQPPSVPLHAGQFQACTERFAVCKITDFRGEFVYRSVFCGQKRGKNTLRRNDYETDKGEKSESHEFRPIVKL